MTDWYIYIQIYSFPSNLHLIYLQPYETYVFIDTM